MGIYIPVLYTRTKRQVATSNLFAVILFFMRRCYVSLKLSVTVYSCTLRKTSVVTVRESKMACC